MKKDNNDMDSKNHNNPHTKMPSKIWKSIYHKVIVLVLFYVSLHIFYKNRKMINVMFNDNIFSLIGQHFLFPSIKTYKKHKNKFVGLYVTHFTCQQNFSTLEEM